MRHAHAVPQAVHDLILAQTGRLGDLGGCHRLFPRQFGLTRESNKLSFRILRQLFHSRVTYALTQGGT
jgi:hypothetical protein